MLVMPWLEGDSPEPDWERLGRLLSDLHARAASVAGYLFATASARR